MENYNLFLAASQKLEALLEKFVSIISIKEIDLRRNIRSDDFDSFSEEDLYLILQFFLGLSAMDKYIGQNNADPKILPLWEKLIKIYKTIPSSFITNFDSLNYIEYQEELYNSKVRKAIALN